MLVVLAISTVLLCFAVQPVLIAVYTAPCRVVEAIPIDVEAGAGLPSKDAVERLGIPDVEWNIHVRGVALVTAAGDAIVQASYTFREREAGSTEWRMGNGRVQTVFPRFVEYRAAVEAYKRGEIEEPLPELLHKPAEKGGCKLDDWGEFTTYDWYGFTFVAAPGSTKQWVKYDHPDNYYTYHPEEWNVEWEMCKYHASTGWKKAIHHYSQAQMGYAISTGDAGVIAYGTAALITEVIALVAVPPLQILALILSAIAALNGVMAWFLENIVQAEQEDGWAYVHADYVHRNLLISYGEWRDWGWYVGPF